MTSRILSFVWLLLSSVLSASINAETIAIIGTGSVGSALGPAFSAQGHVVTYGSREPRRSDVEELVARTGNGASAAQPAEAARNADIVVLAVPGFAAVDIARGLGDLSGKIILDPTNVFDEAGDNIRHGSGGKGSNAQLIQDAQPRASVVKGFNALNWRVMVDPELAGGPVTVPLAGDDAQAKETIAALVEGMGLHPADVGSLEFAHTLEEMLIMWANTYSSSNGYNFYLRPLP